MTQKANNLNIHQRVKEFVSELNGRYKNHVSDEFLIALLEHEIKRAYVIPVKRHIREADNFLLNMVYDVGANIFESILEGRCKAGGNGHHVAQNLAKAFN